MATIIIYRIINSAPARTILQYSYAPMYSVYSFSHASCIHSRMPNHLLHNPPADLCLHLYSCQYHTFQFTPCHFFHTLYADALYFGLSSKASVHSMSQSLHSYFHTYLPFSFFSPFFPLSSFLLFFPPDLGFGECPPGPTSLLLSPASGFATLRVPTGTPECCCLNVVFRG